MLENDQFKPIIHARLIKMEAERWQGLKDVEQRKSSVNEKDTGDRGERQVCRRKSFQPVLVD